jgi:L,D-peptidoglycan transpeptidase YkuD (ErfK/YbiS/YcfS/YnhG family)
VSTYPIESGGYKATRRALPIIVRQRPGNVSQGLLTWGQTVFPCALGRGGIRAIKREGDGATPLVPMRLLYGWYRHGKLASLRSGLALRRATSTDGWCDAPADRNYNRPVPLPYPASAETMVRKDRLYDCCIVMDYNIRSRRRGMGSAIFFHVAKPGFLPTEGCIAVDPKVMARLLPRLSPRTVVKVVR